MPGDGWRFDADWNAQFPVVISASVAYRAEWRDELFKFLEGDTLNLISVRSASGEFRNHAAGISSSLDYPLTLT